MIDRPCLIASRSPGMTPQNYRSVQEAEVMNAATFRAAALFSGHHRGVDVGVAQLEQEQMTYVSGSIPVWVWLAALSVEGGRVVDGWWSGWRLPQPYSLPATASGVMT